METATNTASVLMSHRCKKDVSGCGMVDGSIVCLGCPKKVRQFHFERKGQFRRIRFIKAYRVSNTDPLSSPRGQ